jgi:sterol 3beta-glucosyltransferase
MLVTILTAGTRGDIQPYIALGLELKKAGLRAQIATFENYAGFVKGFGLEFYPIRGNVAEVASSNLVQDAMKADNPLKLLLSFNTLKSLIYDVQKDFFTACAGSDAIVYHPGAPIGYFIAQHLKIPSILATPFPMTPTQKYPLLIFYDKPRLGKRFNYFSHKIFEQIMWSASKAPVQQFWKAQFGHLPQDFGCPFPRQMERRSPTIVSCSNHVFPRPDDWPEYVHNTGYWFFG